MVSDYFMIKVSNQRFKDDLNCTINELKDKKVLFYGAGEGFNFLNKNFNLTDKLNVVAIADKKFESDSAPKEFLGIKAIAPDKINEQDYDVIMISNEYSEPILRFIRNDLNIDNKDVRCIFNEDIPEERQTFNYLQKYKFEKHIQKLTKKLSKKTVVIYGAGIFFEALNKFYDLSGLDIIAIADRKFDGHAECEKFAGYPVCAPSEIIELKPDYVLVATKFFINIIEDLYYNTLKGTKIKIKPLVKKPFMTLIKEIWG